MSNIRIDVDSTEVVTRSGNGARGVWTSREQAAWVFLFERNGSPQPHPQRMVIRLDENQQPYPVGKYELANESFYLGDFGRLAVFPRLRPIAAVVQKAA